MNTDKNLLGTAFNQTMRKGLIEGLDESLVVLDSIVNIKETVGDSRPLQSLGISFLCCPLSLAFHPKNKKTKHS